MVSTHSFVTFLSITQGLSKIKKNPEHPFVDIVQCAKFQQKILNFLAVRDSQSFRIFTQIACFSKIIELRLNLGIEFCITSLVLLSYKKITP